VVKLGDSLHEDACPHCHEELKHNMKPLILVRKEKPQKAEAWLDRFFSTSRELLKVKEEVQNES
jgi:hypothetical protein